MGYRMKPVQSIVLVLLSGLLLTSCKTLMADADGNSVLWHSAASRAARAADEKEKKEPVELPDFAGAKTLTFTKAMIRIPRGTHIGSFGLGQDCHNLKPDEEAYWRGGSQIADPDQFAIAFQNEFEIVGYEVIGVGALFKDNFSDRAELSVGAVIKEMDTFVCFMRGHRYRMLRPVEGIVNMTVQWQIYSNLDKQVVYATNTETESEFKLESDNPLFDALLEGFSASTRSLLEDRGFQELALGKVSTAQPGYETPIRLNGKKPYTGPIKQRMEAVRDATVRVRSGGGYGSGFFIDSTGYLLTNNHVVGDSRTVKVIFNDQTEVTGEVLRSHRVRDVALVRIEKGNYTALPIRKSEPDAGEEVYAIGAPFDEALFGSVSRGIVGGFRQFKDKPRLLQSDVTIQGGNSGGPLVDAHGNVVALCVSGIGELNTGINFFIPIHEGLEKLNIELTRS